MWNINLILFNCSLFVLKCVSMVSIVCPTPLGWLSATGNFQPLSAGATSGKFSCRLFLCPSHVPSICIPSPKLSPSLALPSFCIRNFFLRVSSFFFATHAPIPFLCPLELPDFWSDFKYEKKAQCIWGNSGQQYDEFSGKCTVMFDYNNPVTSKKKVHHKSEYALFLHCFVWIVTYGVVFISVR